MALCVSVQGDLANFPAHEKCNTRDPRTDTHGDMGIYHIINSHVVVYHLYKTKECV